MAVLEQRIDNFAGGIADDPRDNDLRKCAMVKHFDIFSNPRKLIPNRSSEADITLTPTAEAANAKSLGLRHFLLASTGEVLALGGTPTNLFPRIIYKSSPDVTGWTNPEAGVSSARIVGCFFEWRSRVWFFIGSSTQSFAVGNATVAGKNPGSITPVGTITTAIQGILGGDNNAYMFYNNKIVKINSTPTVTDNIGPTLPSDMRITCAALWGNYIAIGMAYGTSATAIPSGKSFVFLWDKASTTTVSEVIDWGEGSLQVLGNVDGRLVGVSDQYLSDAAGIKRGAMVVREWNGGAAAVVKEIIANQTVTLGRFLNESFVKNNKLYWVASVPMNQSTSTESTYHLGIWSYGRKNRDSNFALSLEYIEEAVDTANFKIVSFGSVGNYWFLNHSNDGSITRSDDAANYTFTSIYETLILNGGDSSKKKKLVGVTVMYNPLPAAGSVTLKYRKDEDSSYTTIFTDSADNSISHSAINIESSGATLPSYKEIQFRIESTGGAEITGLKYRYEEIEDDKY